MNTGVKCLCALLLTVGLWQTAEALWISAKATLAQQLIANSWQLALRTPQPQKPWPWADTWPIARLQMASKGVDLYILEGSHGASLAFGPGHVINSAAPGEVGVSIIGGHRDTHFQFLQHLKPGDQLQLSTLKGDIKHYQVSATAVRDSRFPLQVQHGSSSKLLLVTCYPFDALPAGGVQRYVVSLHASGDADEMHIRANNHIEL